MIMVVLCCANFVFIPNCFVLSHCMLPTVTLQETNFSIWFPPGLILRFPPLCAVTSTLCGTARLIELVRCRRTHLERALPLPWLFDECCVVDIWRYLHPSSSGYTWMHPDGSVYSRINLVGCPFVWVPSVSLCEIVPCRFSDHCAALLYVNVPDVVPPGPGLWKVNTSILEEEAYVSLVEDFWPHWRDQKDRFPSLAK